MSGLSDRSSTRVDPDEVRALLRLPFAPDKGADSVRIQRTETGSRHRVSHRQLQELHSQLSERDLAVLGHVADYRLLTIKHLVVMAFTSHASTDSAARTCRRVTKRLTETGLLHRLERRVGGVRAGSAGQIFSVSPLGHRLLGSTGRKRLREPSRSLVKHTLAIADLASELLQAEQHGHIRHLAIETEPTAWRNFEHALRAETLKPDLHVQFQLGPDEYRWFIEIDRNTESTPRIQRKCQQYHTYWQTGIEQAAHDLFPKTLWVTPDRQRAQQLAAAINADRNVEDRLFAVTTADHAATVLTSHASEDSQQ